MPSPGTAEFSAWAGEVGKRVVTNGIESEGPALASLAAVALARGVDSEVVALLSDDGAPEVTRSRAVAVVSGRLARACPNGGGEYTPVDHRNPAQSAA